LVMPDGNANDAFLQDIAETLHERFEITHSTVQVVRQPSSIACVSWEKRSDGITPQSTAATR
jgi:cobalt-zinc-cadmium efflux system protein